jgi:hypothetical protein
VVEAIVFAAVSTLLYYLGTGFLLFLIPLQVALVRKGTRVFLASLGLAFALILAVKFVIPQVTSVQGAPFVVMEMFVVVALMAGLVLSQLPDLTAAASFGKRRVVRFLAATAAAGLLSVPVILYLRASTEFTSGLSQLFDGLAGALNRAFRDAGAGQPLGAEAALATLSGRQLQQFIGEVFWRSFLLAFFLLLAASWWLGSWVGARSLGRRAELPRPRSFRLPELYIWPLIGALGLLLLSLATSLGPLGYAAWNAALILMFLYGVAGVGVLQFLLERYRVPRGMRWLLGLILVILVLTPRANLVVLIGLPALGVSEIWLKYRSKERSNVKQ